MVTPRAVAVHPGVDLTGGGYNHIGQMHETGMWYLMTVELSSLLVNEYQPLLCQVYLCNLNIPEKTDRQIELSEKNLEVPALFYLYTSCWLHDTYTHYYMFLNST